MQHSVFKRLWRYVHSVYNSAVCSVSFSRSLCVDLHGRCRISPGNFSPCPGIFFSWSVLFSVPYIYPATSLPCCMLFAAFGRRNLSVRVLFVEFGSWNLLFCCVCCCYVCCCYVCCCAVWCCNVCCCCFFVVFVVAMFIVVMFVFAMVVVVIVVDVMFVVVVFVVVIVVVIVFIVVMVLVDVAVVVVAGYAQINTHKYVSKWLPVHTYIYMYIYVYIHTHVCRVVYLQVRKLYIVYLFFQQLHHLLCKGDVRTTVWSQYEIRSFGLVDSMCGSCSQQKLEHKKCFRSTSHFTFCVAVKTQLQAHSLMSCHTPALNGTAHMHAHT